MSEFCQTIISSSVGGFIGGALALVGVYVAHNLTAKNEDKTKSQLIQGLVRSIHNEINTLWKQY